METRDHRCDRIGGRAAPWQSTSRLLPGGPTGRKAQAGVPVLAPPSGSARMFSLPLPSTSSSSPSSTAWRWRGAASIGVSSEISAASPLMTPRLGNRRAEHEHAGLERPHRFVVGLHTRRQAALERLHVSGHHAQAVVELGAELLDLACALRQRLLLPPERHRPEQCDEHGRRREQHAVRHGVLLERGIRLVGRRQQLVARDERHHLLWRFELPPVLLLGQLVHVGAQLPGVLTLEDDARLVVVRIDQLEEGVERDLGVDDHVPSPGHVHDQVGTKTAVLGAGGHLLVEVTVLEHAGHLDHPAQLDLAPAPPSLRRAQRSDQVPGLLLQLLVPEMELGQLLAQHVVGTLALELHLPQPELVARQRLAQRVQELRDGLLTLGQVTLRRGAGLAELRVGQGQELLVVPGQGLGRQLGERAGQADPFLLGPCRRFGGILAHQLELAFGDGAVLLGRRRQLGDRSQFGRLLGRGRLGVRQPALGHTCCTSETGAPHEVPGDADRQTHSEPEDHSDHHEANVTTGCHKLGDLFSPGPAPPPGSPTAARSGGRHACSEPVA